MGTKAKLTAPMTKNFTKLKKLSLLIAAMALSSSIVYADNGGNFVGGSDSFKGGHECQLRKHHLMSRVLNLTEDQQKQFKEIKKKQRETMKNAFEQIKSNREALNAEIVKAAPDMNKINDLQAQFKTIQSQMADNRLNSLLEIKKIMTPEQFAGYMALEKERKLMARHHKFGKEWAGHEHEARSSDSE